MERDAALELWGRSVERHNLRYRTMLSDGDSTAFNALAAAQPHGPTRPITKLECTNHLPKRMGTALRKASKDGRFDGRGEGRLTKEKCQRLQNYFRSAILNNLEDQRAMEQAIWATFFHVTSTDEDPHHDRCPAGPASWCFFQRARAEGQPPPPHAGHHGTALSREVSHAVLPIYRRMTNPILLKRAAHGKTQNSNESLHNVMWGHCPKEVFVGKDRVEAATAEAVAKFNRGNFALAQVMDHMRLPITELTHSALAKKDKVRVQKAERATDVAAVAARRARCAGRQRQLEQREDQKAERATDVAAVAARRARCAGRQRQLEQREDQEAERATDVAAVAARRARCAGRQRQLEQREDQEAERATDVAAVAARRARCAGRQRQLEQREDQKAERATDVAAVAARRARCAGRQRQLEQREDQKAERATDVAAVAARRARCAGRQRQLEQREDQEGEVYGAGLMAYGGWRGIKV
ncbi:coiled-coil domain-containing protein 177-like [Littorina saxatilis]|uniref:coiled-coil domain-containing protein 177-like n=1 Tax=Littorina saxatilis TaxID=31220 RepID=UPI0038B43F8C